MSIKGGTGGGGWAAPEGMACLGSVLNGPWLALGGPFLLFLVSART